MLEILNVSDFDEFYKLMQDSFPSDEYRPYAEQLELFNRPEFSAYAVYSDDRKVMAFITVWDFNSFVYVEHFAVSALYRNNGLGGKILNELSKIHNADICLEVERPETEFSKRRINFYGRNGYYLNDYNYVQPPISKGKKPVPLQIMSTNGKLSESQFNNVKNTLYKHVYGVEENYKI